MADLARDRAQGRTSIILVTDSSLHETEACVAAIRQHTSPGCFELIVLDLDPDRRVSRWLSEQDGLSFVDHRESLSRASALNRGIAAASGDNVLLLSARVTVTAGYLPKMLTALHSDPAVGAVAPATDSTLGQTVPAGHRSAVRPAHPRADSNRSDPAQWDRRLRLSDECLLLKREAIDSVGAFNDTLVTLHGDDYSFRLISAGWTMLYAKDVSVHHSAGSPRPLRPEELRAQRERFVAAWGFDPTYSSIQRSELVALLDAHGPQAPLRVLEIGCACGATLLEIKNRYPKTEIYGIELNEGAAAVGRCIADIRPMNAEEPLDYPEDYFDYVITADVLEHLVDPWRVVSNVRPHLKETGTLIASIPNIMHVSVMRGLLNGRFTYQDAGLLDRTHLRFFTLAEIDHLFAGAGYGARTYIASTIPTSNDDLLLVEALKGLSSINTSDQFLVYQYLVKVAKQ
jgi:O-antigen biosynthesis protein